LLLLKQPRSISPSLLLIHGDAQHAHFQARRAQRRFQGLSLLQESLPQLSMLGPDMSMDGLIIHHDSHPQQYMCVCSEKGYFKYIFIQVNFCSFFWPHTTLVFVEFVVVVVVVVVSVLACC
jgi:hypothetical protein